MRSIRRGLSEAETYRTGFLRKLARRGRRGARLGVSDAHDGIKAAVSKVFRAAAKRFAATAKTQWRKVVDQLRPKVPKLAGLMDEAEPDVLACMTFPAAHRVKLHSTNSLERPDGEVKRRTGVAGIFPNERSITRLAGAILLEQNDEWAVQRTRTMSLGTIANIGDDPLAALSAMAAARPARPSR